MDFDVVVIGAGPGGYVCAIRAAQLGQKVAVVEKDSALGGTCLNRGCIPTKAILQSAKIKHFVERSDEFGILSTFEKVDLDKIVARSKDVIATLNKGVANLFQKNKITTIAGVAKFKDKNTLVVERDGKTSEISGKNIVISTGALPRILPGIPQELFEKGLVWTSKEAIAPKFFPKKLLIIGSGAIGIELASFYHSVGSEVTVAEVQDRILIMEDTEISEAAKKSFIKQGIKIKLSVKSQNFRESGSHVVVDFVDSQGKVDTDEFDAVVLAVGVVPNTSELGLAEVGIKTKSNGIIETFGYQETSVKGIYAIGDVVEAPWLAHKASREGIICAEKISGLSDISPINLKQIPSCTYSNPQIASIGMNEEQAKESGIGVKVGKSYFRGNGKALSVGESEGFVKVIFDEKTGELLGAHMIGYEVTELLPIFSVAIAGELTEKELMAAVFPHPTMSECLQEAVCSAYNKAIHG